jgi:HK97 family phage prohead protease
MAIILKTSLSASGDSHAASLIRSGAVDKTSDWSFSADDGNKLLGSGGDDWNTYAKWFLGVDTAEDPKSKAHYKYPFGKDGKVFRSALIAIRQRAAQQSDDPIYAAAGKLVDQVDGKSSSVPVGKSVPAMIQRAYSKFDIKSLDDSIRTLEGIATTPTPDRSGDIVEPKGAEFDLPLPFLWQHDTAQPIGNVVSAKATGDGIPVKIQLAKVDDPGTLKDRLDEAWQSLKYKLVRGLSIGFAPLEYSYMEDTGGYRFVKWAWLELSAVTIPCNAEASIATIKSYDRIIVPRKVVRLAEKHVVYEPAPARGPAAHYGDAYAETLESMK